MSEREDEIERLRQWVDASDRAWRERGRREDPEHVKDVRTLLAAIDEAREERDADFAARVRERREQRQ